MDKKFFNSLCIIFFMLSFFMLKLHKKSKGEKMKTNQVMESVDRELCGHIVQQRTKDGFFNLTDLVVAGNKWRVKNDLKVFTFGMWLKNKGTQEFIEELEGRYGKVLIKSTKKGEKTWGHPLLFIDLALAISPKLKIEVYEWLQDFLIKYRCDSADSYSIMCGVLFKWTSDKANFSVNLMNLAKAIKKECGLGEDGNWNKATQEQLKKREIYHNNIIGLCGVLRSSKEAVRLGFHLSREQIKNQK